MQGRLAPRTQQGWSRFFEKLRIDIIEAQCALESQRLARASELIEGVLRDARRTERVMRGDNSSQQAGTRATEMVESFGSSQSLVADP
jgi:hypothetical protein